MFLWGATRLFSQLQQALNAIWDVRPKAGRSWIEIARTRLLRIIMGVCAGIVVLVWIYYSAQVVFLCAEFTQAYTKMRRSVGESSTEAESCVRAPRRDRLIDVT